MIRFGTAGLRGIMAPGDDYLNPHTIAKATLAVGKFLGKPSRVAICYDTRKNSREYAELTASILSMRGHAASITSEAAPSPLLAHLLTDNHHDFDLGIMITASHNSKEYNGYKVYHRDGYQLMPDDCHTIELYMDHIRFDEVATALIDSHSAHYDILDLGELIEYYVKDMSQLQIMKNRPEYTSFSISYNPMHGVGARMLPAVLDMVGYSVEVNERYLPDNGEFQYLPEPNPEVDSAAFPNIENETADVLLATDPDADRLRMAYRDYTNNSYKVFNGHEIAVLLAYYLAQRDWDDSGVYAAKSIVTTKIVDRILADFEIPTLEVPVGFKYIGYEAASSSGECILGMEETLGYQIEDFSRDKDSILTAVVLMDMVSYYHSQETTLLEIFDNIKKQYGDFYTEEISTPATNTKAVIDALELAFLGSNEFKVVNHNYDQRYPNNMLEIGNHRDTTYVRPSGTEPKLKFYYESTDKKSVDRLKSLVNIVLEELDNER